MKESFGVVVVLLEASGDTGLARGVVCLQQEQKPFGEMWDLSPLPSQKTGALWEGRGGGVLRPQDLSHSRCPAVPSLCRGMCSRQGAAPEAAGCLALGSHLPASLRAGAGATPRPRRVVSTAKPHRCPPPWGPPGSASAPRKSDRALSCYPTTCLGWRRDWQSEGLHTSQQEEEARQIASLPVFRGLQINHGFAG